MNSLQNTECFKSGSTKLFVHNEVMAPFANNA